ncbi:hypothetical protein P8452_02591 [Trifolium repens]|nr:hypothetical protein P8452_02591 [Trifolium repens]
MALREIYLNENINNYNEDNQIPDLNVSLEELDVGFNQNPSISMLQLSPPSHVSFDLNDELFVLEDDTETGKIVLQSNSNNDQPISENSSSTYFSYDFNNDILLESALQFERERGDEVTNPQVPDATKKKVK